MDLTADLMESTLQGLKGDGGGGPASQRAVPRVALRATVNVVPYVDNALGKPERAWTRDFSVSGVGVLFHRRMKIGAKFVIPLPREEGKPLLLLCTVRNCESVPGNLFLVGASFARVTAPPTDPSKVPSKTADVPAEQVDRISRAILS